MVKVAVGADDMQAVVDDWLWNHNAATIAIRDDYEWWARSGER